MANANRPSGLSPFLYKGSNSWNGMINTYYIPSTDTNAYAIGDPVKTLTGAADSNGVSAVTIAVAGSSNVLRGVIVTMGGTLDGGPFGDPSNQFITVIPATKAYGYYVGVVDDPDVTFECQEFSGSGSTNFTAADIGKNVNLKSGTNNGYISGWVLDDTAASTTANTGQVRLLGITRRSDNAFGSYCKFIIGLNLHELNYQSSGV